MFKIGDKVKFLLSKDSTIWIIQDIYESEIGIKGIGLESGDKHLFAYEDELEKL